VLHDSDHATDEDSPVHRCGRFPPGDRRACPALPHRACQRAVLRRGLCLSQPPGDGAKTSDLRRPGVLDSAQALVGGPFLLVARQRRQSRTQPRRA
jgi:hypothetical protein